MREDNLLNYIYQSSHQALADQVTLGPGDDMGMVCVGHQKLLVAVDQLIDSLHFDLQTTSLRRIGRKALTRNLSDIAAMAAVPVAAVVAVCLPKDFGEKKAQQLFDHISHTGAEFNCPVVGGDISIWDGRLTCCVTVLAKPDGIESVLRQGASIGDAIYVTGDLGGSLEPIDGYLHHTDFTPLITTARTLASHPSTRPRCMIDISDGLAKDLERLCIAADYDTDNQQIGALVEIDQLPVSRAAQQLARRTGKPPWQHAAGDGEDYQLLFTAPKGTVPQYIDDVKITPIGKITALKENQPRLSFICADGSIADIDHLGWEHGR